nr:MAG TPA: hypothetical protein [Crassvirales sp.]
MHLLLLTLNFAFTFYLLDSTYTRISLANAI